MRIRRRRAASAAAPWSRDEAHAWLTSHGVGEPTAVTMLDQAAGVPCQVAYAPDRRTWAVHLMPAGRWDAGPADRWHPGPA